MNADLVGCQLVVDLSECINLALNLLLVKRIEEDLNVLLSIKGYSGGLASNCGWVDLYLILIFQMLDYNKNYDIFQNCCVNCGECSASWSLLSSVSLGYSMGLQ